jgi:homoserine/homoserine lactone efflux protein
MGIASAAQCPVKDGVIASRRMTLSGILLFAATEFLLSLTPGPAVLLVISQGMRGGFRTSARAAAGILSGNAIYFAASAAGLGALLIASQRVFVVLEWAGAIYLALLGLKMVFFPSEPGVATSVVDRSAFRQGLLTQLANPKAIAFFTALLPQFIDPHQAMPMQFIVLGIVSITVELPVLLFYGYAADRGRERLSRHAMLVQRLAGACLVVAAARLAAAHF